MKFMHLADLHLDSPFKGMTTRFSTLKTPLINSPYQAFDRSVEIAIQEEVEFILISGDLFDAENQTIYAQNYFVQKMRQLNESEIAVIIIHGNHDFLHSDRLTIQYPDNVYIFPEQEVTYYDLTTKNNQTVRIYGFSYEERWIQTRMIDAYPMNPKQTDFTIGMLHGNVSSPSQKDNYAPFTVDELLSKQYDYWALGHIHLQQTLNQVPPIQYAGTIQGRHRNERGDKGGYLVTLNQHQAAEVEFISLAPILWENVTLQADESLTSQDLVDEMNQIIQNFHEQQVATGKSYLINVIIEQAELLNESLIKQLQQGELMETLTIEESDLGFVAIHHIDLKFDLQYQPFEYDPKLKESFNHAKKHFESSESFQTAMHDLTNHALVKQWFSEFVQSDDFESNVTEQAVENIFRHFQREREEADYEN